MNRFYLLFLLTFLAGVYSNSTATTIAIQNIAARPCQSLNGQWQIIIDATDAGSWRQVFEEKKPVNKTDFFEYSFQGGPLLHVPGDFNSQLPELTYYEGTVWYKKAFVYNKNNQKRVFLHFGAVNYLSQVYLNGKLLGTHEGGFTPFQFEITSQVAEGENALVVKVNNKRQKDGIPGLGYDWLNYGGITRDVNLLETSLSYIDDYVIQLKKQSQNEVLGWVKMNGQQASQLITVQIPELKINYITRTNESGLAQIKFKSKPRLWSPESPTLYKVIIQSETDTIVDHIGFRTIETNGPSILLNGKPIFLKGINIHEENPIRGARACNESDALMLLTWAKELGCNFVRLAHYPHTESMVKLAEKMGLLVWSEIPAFQRIEFAAPGVPEKLSFMLQEMIQRDKNRCAVFVWSLSNETYTDSPNRDNVLKSLAQECRTIDSTRLITAVTCNQKYSNNTVEVWDSIYRYYDIISVNEYLGWYIPWQGNPKAVKWNVVYPNKPLIISEFGAESLYGSNLGPIDEASSWSEAYQAKVFKDQIDMFANIPNLVGVAPWILADFRSPWRMNAITQNGWNRKGVLSDRGEKKQAWYALKSFYDTIKCPHVKRSQVDE